MLVQIHSVLLYKGHTFASEAILHHVWSLEIVSTAQYAEPVDDPVTG